MSGSRELENYLNYYIYTSHSLIIIIHVVHHISNDSNITLKCLTKDVANEIATIENNNSSMDFQRTKLTMLIPLINDKQALYNNFLFIYLSIVVIKYRTKNILGILI